jgi:putative alpha-1,2-mannosidase
MCFHTKCSLFIFFPQTTHDHFSNSPHGLPGNDDYGSMSSFLLFAALGVYPNAGTTTFVIGEWV